MRAEGLDRAADDGSRGQARSGFRAGGAEALDQVGTQAPSRVAESVGHQIPAIDRNLGAASARVSPNNPALALG